MEADWQRPQYEAGGGDASVLFVVFGPRPEPLRITGADHRVVPMELQLELGYEEPQSAKVLLNSPVASILLQDWPGEKPTALSADGCMVIRAEVPDPKDLLYFRNCLGVVAAVLDAGGRGVANLQSLSMLTPEQWRRMIFDADLPQPRLHVNVFHDEEEGGTVWLHTRGLRVFGRPDLSIRGVPPAGMEAAAQLCNRLIEAQAFGAVVHDGPVDGPPEGLVARTTGSPEDPDFNNVHVELDWPAGG